jgi:hypothetical protein
LILNSHTRRPVWLSTLQLTSLDREEPYDELEAVDVPGQLINISCIGLTLSAQAV